MDSITQAALGAVIGQGAFRKLGRRAAVFGAFCGTLPDLDSFFSGADPWARLVAHRGISHSLLVLPLVAIPLGWLAWRFFGRRGNAKTWMHLAFWSLITHPLLDGFTTYGTQLFAPLTDERFAWDTVGIIDLFYTVPMLVALGWGMRKKADPKRAAYWARRSLSWGCLYLALQWGVTQWAVAGFEDRLELEGIQVVESRAPAPALFPMLRHGVARTNTGAIATATLTPWDMNGFSFVLSESDQSERIQSALESERGKILLWFGDDFVSVHEEPEGGIAFIDHRYGFFTRPDQSMFRAFLPPENTPDEILLRHPRQAGRKSIDMKSEFLRGWEIVMGEREVNALPETP